jgi:hypothetical protein
VVELSHIEKYEMDMSLVLAGHEPGLHVTGNAELHTESWNTNPRYYTGALERNS